MAAGQSTVFYQAVAVNPSFSGAAGQDLAAHPSTILVSNITNVLMSKDLGKSWVVTKAPRQPYNTALYSPQGYMHFAVSQDGSCMYSGTIGSTDYNLIYASTNAGASWSLPSKVPFMFSNTRWVALLTSAAGDLVLAVPTTTSPGMYWSTDHGQTFVAVTAPAGYSFFTAAIMSANGATWVIAVMSTGSTTQHQLYSSSNHGQACRRSDLLVVAVPGV